MEDFSKLDAVEEVGGEVKDKSGGKADMKQLMELFRQTVAEDPTIMQRLNSLSDNVAVVNTLGFGEGGSLIQKEPAPGEEVKYDEDGKPIRELVPTAKIVGYAIQNVGDTPINYVTEEFAKNEQGIFVGQKVEKVLAPGEKAALSRKYMTIFCSRPEVAFTLKNGKIVRKRPKQSGKAQALDAYLESHYFIFSDPNLKVNSDTVKINIGVKKKTADGTVKWVVKPEFEKTFGYLNNPKAAGTRGRGKSAGTKITPQQLAANYINKLLQESGVI